MDAERKQRLYRYVPIGIGAMLVLAVVGTMVWWIGSMEKKPEGPKRQTAQVVKLIRPPPPPEQPPPPPEKVDEPIEQAPQEAPEQAAEQPMGVDAAGAAGSDGFGLAARPGGRDLIGTGNAPFKWYTSLMANRLQECLSSDERLRRGSYRANLRVQVTDDGRIDIVELVGSSGSVEKDTAIRSMKQCQTGERRPLEMPKLAAIQVVSRG